MIVDKGFASWKTKRVTKEGANLKERPRVGELVGRMGRSVCLGSSAYRLIPTAYIEVMDASRPGM